MNLEFAAMQENIDACEAQIAASGAVLGMVAACLGDYEPVHIDRERMDRALAGPRWTLPEWCKSSEQILRFFDDVSAGKIAPDGAEEFEITRGSAIEPLPQINPQSTTPRGLTRIATDGERANGRLAWVPGI